MSVMLANTIYDAPDFFIPSNNIDSDRALYLFCSACISQNIFLPYPSLAFLSISLVDAARFLHFIIISFLFSALFQFKKKSYETLVICITVLVLGVPSVALCMFIRRKPNKSGVIGVQIIDKSSANNN